MKTADIMVLVNKEQAVQFITLLKASWPKDTLRVSNTVSDCLMAIGVDAIVNEGTANAVISRMEKKSKINLF